MKGTPHVDKGRVILNLRSLSDEEAEQAADCYAAIVRSRNSMVALPLGEKE